LIFFFNSYVAIHIQKSQVETSLLLTESQKDVSFHLGMQGVLAWVMISDPRLLSSEFIGAFSKLDIGIGKIYNIWNTVSQGSHVFCPNWIKTQIV